MLDTHTHAWGPPSPDRPWVNGAIAAAVDGFDVSAVYTADRLLGDMDRNGVDEAVVVGYPICDWRDNSYTLEAVESSDRLYGVVMVDPFADGAADRLRECMAVDGVVGVRLGAACPYDRMWETFDPGVTWLRDAVEETEFWDAAVETDAAVQILCDHRQLDQALDLLDAYPELTYLFDHFAHAGPGVPLDEGTLARFEDVAAYDNAAVKVSEVVHRSEEGFPYADMHDHVRWFLEQFGRERVVWGSDYPNVSDVATYGEARHWLRHVETLSAADREWLLGRSFREHVGVA
ncbi:amidohydrolase family protein [Candidatus Halobonum tyrrellensis]|uniref:amidohydrolase family protein n=1 Tax=Candidatus Halobonum tyrrellensis TaxID=1431545 RepID=UPI000677A51E|nr:amidohydrolase family protein [Candidatus Halobonum tyrrellensis]